MEDILENEVPEKPKCLNCGDKMPRKATFCPHCGQRNNQGKVSMKELLRRFWSNFSHLDSKFVKMCWQLLIPGKVTMEYFAGRQKRYPHPVQFFFVVMFFFLLLLSKFSNSKSSGLNMTGNDGEFTIGQKTVKTGDQEIKINNVNFFESIQRYELGRELRNAVDSMPVEWRTVTTMLTILYAAAGFGLWQITRWGLVVWIFACLTQIVMHTLLSNYFGSNNELIFTIIVLLTAYLVFWSFVYWEKRKRTLVKY